MNLIPYLFNCHLATPLWLPPHFVAMPDGGVIKPRFGHTAVQDHAWAYIFGGQYDNGNCVQPEDGFLRFNMGMKRNLLKFFQFISTT
jgi:hypothetical protein